MDFYDILLAKKLNGEGGGVGEALKGKIRVKIVNSSTSSIVPFTADQTLATIALYIDGGIYCAPLSFEESIIMPNSHAYADYIFIGNNDGERTLWKALTNEMVTSQNPVRMKTVTELVNCTLLSDQIVLTDPTLEASCTIEYEDVGQ